MQEYALVAAVAAAVTYLLTGPARRLAQAWGAYTPVRDRDVHAIPVPRLGGLAIYAGVAAALGVAGQLPALQRAFTDSRDALAVLLAGGVVVLVGVVDDKWGLDPLTKLAGQTVAAGVLVTLGVTLASVPVPGLGTLYLGAESVPLTILLVVVTINAVNFVDGLDGLASGVVAIAALALFAFCFRLSEGIGFDGLGFNDASPPTLITAVLAGACLGFLPHNVNPAQVFMGDSGAMLIGLMLAAGAISLTGQIDFGTQPVGQSVPLLLPLLLPLAVLAVPFVDLLLAVVRRTRAGRSPFAPDKAHLHHRLLEIGHSHARAVLIMYAWTAVIAFGAVALAVVGDARTVLAVLGALALLTAIASGVPRLRARGVPR